MKKYTYTGDQPCHLTVLIGNEIKEISMYQGGQYELPADNKKVERYEAAGILKPVFKTQKNIS